MANVATARTPVGMAMSSGLQGFSQVTPVVCTFDTLSSALTIYTPAAGNHAAIIGLVYQEASAHSLTITAGSTALVTLERPASAQIIHPVGTTGFIAIGAKGEALALTCTTAVISTLLAYVVEFPSINFNAR